LPTGTHAKTVIEDDFLESWEVTCDKNMQRTGNITTKNRDSNKSIQG